MGEGVWRARTYNADAGPGRAPDGDAESFLSILIQMRSQNVAKIKDLNDNSPQCLRQTVSRSYDQPLLLVNGGGRPVHPYLVPLQGS